MKKLVLIGFLLSMLAVLSAQEYQFYALSSDGGNSKPVYLCSLDSTSGAISIIEQYSGVVSGSYFAISSDHKHLLASSSNSGKDQGGLVQYDIFDDGTLSLIRSQLKPGGTPNYVSFTPDKKSVLSAYYGDDKISLCNFINNEITSEIDYIEKPDNSKGHCILTDPNGKYVYAVFLGLDKVFIYLIEEDKFVENPNQPFFTLPDGYGPRHLVFHPDSNWVYIVNELNSSVTAGSYNMETGAITEIQNISMLPPEYSGDNSAAAIRIHPNGKYLYASNRGYHSIVAYEISGDGKLSLIEYETSDIDTPRDFNISPDGKFMLVGNKRENSILSFRIDDSTGELNYTGMKLEVSSPLAFVFLPSFDEGQVGIYNMERKYDGRFTAFPNPARDVLYLHSPDETAIEKIEIYSFSGQYLTSFSCNSKAAIDVSLLSRGTFVLVLSTEIRKYYQKIILN